RTVVLRREQGFGDAIQFIRYAPMLKGLGATVWLHVGPGIGDLARRFAGIDRVFDDSDALPDFDYYIQLMSLPRMFGTDIDSIPADVPYVGVDPNRIGKWARRLGEGAGLRVGLVWAGHPNHYRDRYRSIRLKTLAPLAEIAGIRFVSLQKGAAASEIATTPEDSVENWSGELNDF